MKKNVKGEEEEEKNSRIISVVHVLDERRQHGRVFPIFTVRPFLSDPVAIAYKVDRDVVFLELSG